MQVSKFKELMDRFNEYRKCCVALNKQIKAVNEENSISDRTQAT